MLRFRAVMISKLIEQIDPRVISSSEKEDASVARNGRVQVWIPTVFGSIGLQPPALRNTQKLRFGRPFRQRNFRLINRDDIADRICRLREPLTDRLRPQPFWFNSRYRSQI